MLQKYRAMISENNEPVIVKVESGDESDTFELVYLVEDVNKEIEKLRNESSKLIEIMRIFGENV